MNEEKLNKAFEETINELNEEKSYIDKMFNDATKAYTESQKLLDKANGIVLAINADLNKNLDTLIDRIEKKGE